MHYDDIEAVYRAGRQIRGPVGSLPDLLPAMGIEPHAWEPIPVPRTPAPSAGFVRAVVERRSRRNYTPSELSLDRWLHLVRLLNLPWRAPRFCEAGISIGFLAANVQGLAAGIYLLDSDQGHWGRLCAETDGEQMATACLNQAWLSHTAVQVLFMTHLPSLDRTWGARGYRYALLTAGRLAQRLYLGASALGLGCCGIGALYDGETRRLIGLDADAALLYLVGLGPVKRLGLR